MASGSSVTSTASPSTITSLAPSSTWSNPFPTTTSSRTFNGGGGGVGNGGDGASLNSSASLYLYTFLATLILLLGVSAAIVFRSLILRRRHRAMIEEAIRNGTWVPPPSRHQRVDPSQKPPMYEANVLVDTKDDHHEWDNIKPFAVGYTLPLAQRSVPAPVKPPPPPPPHARLRSTLRHVWSHFDSSTPPNPATELTVVPAPPALPDSSSGPLYVSVLVAMPSQHTVHADNEELPHVEFGVTHITVSTGPEPRRDSDDVANKM